MNMHSKLFKFAGKRALALSWASFSRAANIVNPKVGENESAPVAEDCSTGSKYKMAAWQIHSYGEVSELEYTDKMRMPRIRTADECLVRVSATSVNPIDNIMLGGYASRPLNALRNGIEFPLTLGREFCGTLIHRGMNASANVSLGDRVWGVVPLQNNGCHAEFVVVPSYCLSRTPECLTDTEAASVLYAGLTAWSGLYITGGLGGVCGALYASGGGANKRILVLGGSGSVGSLAIQMLKSQNAQVVSTCSDDAMEMVHNLGADFVVDYGNKDQMDSLRCYAPYDIVLDCAGLGPAYANNLKFNYLQYITFSAPLVRNIDEFGFGLGTLRNIADLVEKNIQSMGEQGGLVKWGFFIPASQGVQFLTHQVERKKILPQIDSSFDFLNLPDAFRKIQAGHLRGKVVVTLQ